MQNLGNYEKILGIDYGLKRIGLAIGDTEQKIALPFQVIENKGKDFVLENLEKIVHEEGIEKIVAGMPMGLGGQKSEQTLKTEEFIGFLKKKLNIPVISEDERLSTKAAEKLTKGVKKQSNDEIAAMIILQNYLDRINK